MTQSISHIIIYFLFLCSLKATPLGRVNMIPKSWEKAHSLSICEVKEGKLVAQRVIKGVKLKNDHWLVNHRAINGRYFIVHDGTHFSAFYQINDGIIIYNVKLMDQTFYIIYDMHQVEQLIKKKQLEK